MKRTAIIDPPLAEPAERGRFGPRRGSEWRKPVPTATDEKLGGRRSRSRDLLIIITRTVCRLIVC